MSQDRVAVSLGAKALKSIELADNTLTVGSFEAKSIDGL